MLQKRAKGQVLLECVFQHLELIEKDYFGLQFSENGILPNPPNSDLMVSNRITQQVIKKSLRKSVPNIE